MRRLSAAALPRLPAGVARPAYDRAEATPGIVHLGVGAFHRAHQAVMTDDALTAGDSGWGIVAASLRSPDTRDALAPQDGLYTLATRAPEGERLRVVGAIREVLVAPESPAMLIAAMADPRVRIVSLTVTEKGYCHDPATGELNEAHPDIVHDLAHPEAPRSAPGFLVAALARRRQAGAAPFTILCCDNLPANGRTVKQVVGRLAALRDRDLGAWVAGEVACPSTMVDRIVPATTDEDRARVSAALGVADAWPVVTEPFIQWVIEDDFSAGRPRWEVAGAEFVADVAPHELMKLRMLNGAHSTLAYLGFLAGHETVADAANDPLFARLLEGFWTEAAPSLPAAPGLDPAAYARRLLARFQNTSIRHRLAQIAMDGSQKLPQRLLGTIRENLAAERPIAHLALGVAAFALHASGVDEKGGPIEVRDPLAPALAERLGDVRRNPEAAARRLMEMRPIFGADLPADPAFAVALAAAVGELARRGARGAVEALAGPV